MATGQKAKRRARAQQLGKLGELTFAAWATKGHLTANKLEDDFGVDYVCQLLEPVGKKGSQEVTGKSVFVQVRATSGADKPRIGLDRVDAETVLRQRELFALVGVRLATGDVYFRWLDIQFMEELTEFLKSRRETLTMRLDRMSQGAEKFAKELRERSKHGHRAKFERARVRLGLTVAIPGAQLRMSAGDDDDEWVAVSVPNVLSVLKGGAEAHEALASVMFRLVPFAAGFHEALSRHGLLPQVLAAAELVDGEFLLRGGSEFDVTLTVESDGQRASSPFLLRRVQDERAYIGSSGLILRITDARHSKATGLHQHEIAWGVSDEGAVDLLESGQLDFLRLLSPQARLYLGSEDFVPLEGATTRDWGHSIQVIEAIYSGLGTPMTGVRLSDLTDEVFALNLGVLETLATPGRVLIGAMLLSIDELEVEEEAWTHLRYRLPITLRLKEHAVLAWISGECKVFLDGGALRAVWFLTRDAGTFELTDYKVEGDGRAEAHLGGGLAPYVLATATPGLSTAPKNVPFAMDFSDLPDTPADPSVEMHGASP